jgi:uncharacterized protein (DUF433 family)
MPTGVRAPIVLDDQGVPYIEGTTMKVIELVRVWQTTGQSPEQLREEFPHLTMEQVYAALSYYHGHQAELDADMERREELADRLREELGQHPAAERIREARRRRG